MPAAKSRSLIPWLVGISLTALLASCFVEFVYLPQKKASDEQQSVIQSLDKALQDLQAEDKLLRKRIAALERRQLKGPQASSQEARASAEEPEAVELGAGSATSKAGEAKPAPSLDASATKASPAPSSDAVATGAAAAHASPVPKTTPSAKAGAAAQAKKAKKARWRDDHKCGPGVEAPDSKTPAECDPDGEFPCCGTSGWCGHTAAHCTCEECVDYRLQKAAKAGPYDEKTLKNIALVVPFRDREAHLQRFRNRINSHVEAWNKKGVAHNWMVFVVEQFDNELFNRGYLFNVGLQYANEHAEKTGQPFDCVVMHDIDIIPEPVVDYGWCKWPNQLSGEIECWSWSAPYPDNVGGVVSLSPAHWTMINGFSNEYEGWGGEDDDLYYRLKQNTLLKGNCHTWCKPNPPKVPMVYRPPLGKGRFNCLHDGDHTPRQRAPNDAPMWARLNAMKANSNRWKDDGLSSLKKHEACEPLESQSCKSCTAPEDRSSRVRLFGEHWSRVSKRPLGSLENIYLRVGPGHQCTNISVALKKLPRGLDNLRSQLPELFGKDCKIDEKWAQNANFVLVDLTLGQALFVGDGAGTVVPDASLPALDAPGDFAERRRAQEAADGESGDHLMQSQRLIRWLRRIPKTHRGWIIAMHEPLKELRRTFDKEGRRVPQTSPVCVSEAGMDGGKKFRVTPGTRWCGDGGWKHLEHFEMLRSAETVARDRLVPICVSLNDKHYTYRFEASEDGCVGYHRSSGTTWKHAQTIHSTRDARGEAVCVGTLSSSGTTRWMMRRQEKCSAHGFSHVFSFKAMAADQYTQPLLRACLLSSSDAGHAVTRLETGDACEKDDSGKQGGRHRELWFLTSHQKPKDYKICMAEGKLEEAEKSQEKTQPKLWRAFWNAACDKQKFMTRDAAGRKRHWTLTKEQPFYVPEDASGARYCLCEITETDKGSNNTVVYYSWFDGSCPKGAQRELCLHDLSVKDILRFSNQIDAVV